MAATTDIPLPQGAQLPKDPSKIKRCPECRRLVEAATMRPLSRTRLGGGVRFACPDCFRKYGANCICIRLIENEEQRIAVEEDLIALHSTHCNQLKRISRIFDTAE